MTKFPRLLAGAFVVLVLSTSLGTTAAQSAPQAELLPATPESIARLIHASLSEVLLTADVFRSFPIADALRIAMVERGVQVYILASASNVEDAASYFMGMHFAGASVRLVERIPSSFIVIDRRSSAYGPAIAHLPETEFTEGTYRVDDAGYVIELIRHFVGAFEIAVPYAPRIDE